MIVGSAEIKIENKEKKSTSTLTVDSMFVPPLIDPYQYSQMLSLKSNEMNNKYLQMKFMYNQVSRIDANCRFTSLNNNLNTLLEN